MGVDPVLVGATLVQLAVLASAVGVAPLGLLAARAMSNYAEQRRLEDAQLARIREEEAKRARAAAEEQARQRQLRFDAFVASVGSTVRFVTKRVQVGTRVTGNRAIGVAEVESQAPADDVVFRGIRSVSELGQLLPSELAYAKEASLARIASGEARVLAHVEHVPVLEAIHEPVWETRRQVLLVLLDISRSMWAKEYGGEWKWPLIGAIARALAAAAQHHEAVFVLQPFDGTVNWPLVTLESPDQYAAFQRDYSLPNGGDTQIAIALVHAVGELKGQVFDKADIVIVTDGEDKNFDAGAMRALLDRERIGLHAILIDVNNAGLRSIADVAQTIDSEGNVATTRREITPAAG